MSYRCQVCQHKVPRGRRCLRHVVRRQIAEERDSPKGRPGSPEYWHKPVGSTLREVKVCGFCHKRLADGASLSDLLAEQQPEQPAPAEPLEVGKVRLGN